MMLKISRTTVQILRSLSGFVSIQIPHVWWLLPYAPLLHLLGLAEGLLYWQDPIKVILFGIDEKLFCPTMMELIVILSIPCRFHLLDAFLY